MPKQYAEPAMMESSYGLRIRQLRKTHNFTQAQFAKACDIGLASIQRYESNERKPTLDAVKKMADVFGISMADFFTIQDPGPSWRDLAQTNEQDGMNRISELRKEQGLSQDELAKKLDVHQTAVSQWEKGRTMPTFELAKLMSSIFNVSLDYLFGLTSIRRRSETTGTDAKELILLVRLWLAKTHVLTPEIAEAIGLLWAAHDILLATEEKLS